MDQQTEKLMSKARSCGYKDSDFVIIGQHESGVKLSTEQREGMQKMYRAIESDPEIKYVFAATKAVEIMNRE